MNKNIIQRQIAWGDLDSLGIVFYPQYYKWIDASSHMFFKSLNIPLGSLWKERGIIFGLVETGCTYHVPGRYDEWIKIVTYVDDISDKVVLLRHDIFHLSDSYLMLEGFEKRICLNVSDPLRFKAIDIPPDIRIVLSRDQSSE
jgi:YbgC/YbaW family acyl-CoA thioester hydrolase